ncbi:cyclopropane-fatty-acyl-phospholipid synthase family protein [Roseibium sp. RKSG952]|uniref:SAM-dependent methyltransferase n=1 Tax=Roseibium sp. RKSG952 TaxID=2529384 RepID=UPI0012BB4A1D|nr:class I SAM-dependent methyltransferase [Roseibium sp. RKSG952]MTH95148.1 methyltransferase domain-containing protein [Roseibium sp. RKSG952]
MNKVSPVPANEIDQWDHSHEFPVRRWIGRNSIINAGLIAASIVLAVFVSPFFLLLWPVAIVLDDLALLAFRFSIFNADEGVQACYRWQNLFMTGSTNAGRDLGFNLFDGDVNKPLSQAQSDKWDFMLDQLGLQAGDRLIDIGCGFGDWLNYAKSKGILVTGVNISDEQAHVGRQLYGLDVIRANWKDIMNDPDLKKRLLGKFDAVTLMDTIEHYAHAADFRVEGKVEAIYEDLFDLCNELIDSKSRIGRVFLSCIHWTEENPRTPEGPERNWTWVDTFSGLLMIRTYSGFYPRGPMGLVRNAADHFNEICRKDRTEDYRYTAVIDRNHFQAPKFLWTFRKVLYMPIFFILDPHFAHKWIGHNALGIKLDAWMRTYGENYDSLTFDADYRARVSHVQLWWIVLQAKKTEVQ